MRTRSLLILLILLVSALVAAGCGGGGDAVAPDPGTTPAADPNAAPVANATDPNASAPALDANGNPIPVTTDTAPPEIPNVKGDDLIGGLGALDGESNLFTPAVTLATEFGEDELQEDPDFAKNEKGFDDTDKSNELDEPKEPAPQKAIVTYGPAKIMLDDQTYTVNKNSVFPSDSQLFQVLSLGADTATVELVAGEFSNGSTGVTLTKGKTVSLVNQNEGITYTLKLVSVEKQKNGAGIGGQGCGFYC